MERETRVTVLVENTASGRGMLGEHGLAYCIETGGAQVLFDTGQTGRVLIHNAERLGVHLGATEAVVLSHGHYDHTGGLEEVLGKGSQPHLFLHPGALVTRFSRGTDGTVREVGPPPGIEEPSLRESTSSLTFTTSPTEVNEKLTVTGEVPRRNDFEDTGGDFYLDEGCTEPDPIVDDQAVFFDTPEGTVVLLGCGHAGVINTLTYIRELTGGRPISAVIGGMHLLHASEERMDRTVEALRQMDVNLLAPAHCTGAQAKARLWAEFQNCWQPCTVGSRFEFRE